MRRLETALDLINGLDCFYLADIGCDHGILSLNALKKGLCKKVVCSDISELSLNKARSLLFGCGNADFIKSDGFEDLPADVDTAVIMGLGGREIEKIITNKKNRAKNLIVSPQNHAQLVRNSLNYLGYKITKDTLAFEGGKFYDIILGEKSNEPIAKLSPVQLFWGVYYKEKSSLLLQKILKTQICMADFKLTEQNLEKIKMLNEVKKWQQ